MRGRIRAMWVALCALVVGALAYLLGVANVLGQRAEASVLDASSFTQSPPAPLGLVSVPMVVVSLLIIALIALWFHGIGRTLSVLLAPSVSILSAQLLKESWLERPQLLELEAWNTFPSGHMTVFVALCGGLIWAVPRALRPIIGIMSAILLGVVTWQLLHFGWHRPSDLLGAAALVVFAFALAAWLGPRSPRNAARQSRAVGAAANKLALIVLTISGVVLFVGGVALVGLAVATRIDALMLAAGTISLIGVNAISARTLAGLVP